MNKTLPQSAVPAPLLMFAFSFISRPAVAGVTIADRSGWRARGQVGVRVRQDNNAEFTAFAAIEGGGESLADVLSLSARYRWPF